MGRDVQARQQAQIVNGVDVERVGHCHHKRFVVAADGNQVMPHGELARHDLQRSGVRRLFGEVYNGAVQLVRQDAKQVRLGQKPQADQYLPQPLAAVTAPLLGQRHVELLRCNKPFFHEKRADLRTPEFKQFSYLP